MLYYGNCKLICFYVARGPCTQYPGGYCPGASSLFNPLTGSFSGPAPLAVPTNPLQHGLEYFFIRYF